MTSFDAMGKKRTSEQSELCSDDGASDEARTRYLHLGKVALYQMSYTRNSKRYYSRFFPFVNY